MEIKKSFVFETDSAKQCHASTILKLPDGRLMAAWFAGTKEKAGDVRIRYSVRDGEGWTKPREIPGLENAPHWNPVLFLRRNGSVRLFFKEGRRIGDWVTKYTDSFDGGETWTKPDFLVLGDATGGRGPVKNKCLRASDGTVIAPASTEKNRDWKPFVDLSFDDGGTWQKVMIPRPDGDPQHPGDLRLGQLRKISQLQHLPVGLRKGAQRFAHRSLRTAVRSGKERLRGFQRDRTRSSGAIVIPAFVAGDLQDPRFKLFGITKCMELFAGGQADLLQQVISLARPAHPEADKAFQRSEIFPQHPFKIFQSVFFLSASDLFDMPMAVERDQPAP